MSTNGYTKLNRRAGAPVFDIRKILDVTFGLQGLLVKSFRIADPNDWRSLRSAGQVTG